MRLIAIILFSLWASIALAETTYEVTGVSEDDVLNIRKGPRASSAKVGEYQAGESGIQIFSTQGNWGLVGRSDPEGWVNMRYLRVTEAASEVELPMACSGTEPFWSLAINSASKATYTDPETEARIYVVRDFERIDKDAAMSLVAGGSVSITAETCSDGMSDNVYPYAVNVLLPGGRKLKGCCR